MDAAARRAWESFGSSRLPGTTNHRSRSLILPNSFSTARISSSRVRWTSVQFFRKLGKRLLGGRIKLSVPGNVVLLACALAALIEEGFLYLLSSSSHNDNLS